MKRWNALLDLLESRWSLILLIAGAVGSFGIPARIVATTESLARFGAIAWLTAGLAGLLICSLTFWIIQLGMRARIVNRFAQMRAVTGGANAQLDSFEQVEVSFMDFYDPYYVTRKGKRFHRSRFVGPGMLHLPGVTFSHCVFKHVQIVIARDNISLFGVASLENAIFTQCDIVNVTLVLNQATYADILAKSPDFGEFVPVIAG